MPSPKRVEISDVEVVTTKHLFSGTTNIYVESWYEKKLKDAGFDLAKPITAHRDHVSLKTIYTQDADA